MVALEDGKLTVTRERMWGQYKRPNEPVLVKLPADPQSKAKYMAKGFKFIAYGGDEIPMAILDTSADELAKISAATIDDLPLYVSEHPYKRKKKS